jgi:hypothetical protein
MVEAENYLAQLLAYLHLNPVRAGICENPSDYPWSSYRTYLSLEQSPWLTTEPVLSQYFTKGKRARELFQEFVEECSHDGHRLEGQLDNLEDPFNGDQRIGEFYAKKPSDYHPSCCKPVIPIEYGFRAKSDS